MKKIVSFILNKIPRFWLMKMGKLISPVLTFFLKGEKFVCPICEGKFRILIPYGYKNVRKNALCPKCFSLERHRLLYLFLKRKTDVFNTKMKLLHIAPEPCLYNVLNKFPDIEYVTADLESYLAKYKVDIQNLPFEDNQFDFIICNHVLEHVDNDRLALKELRRVLKNDGRAVITVPIDFTRDTTFEDFSIASPEDRLKYYNQKDHQRLYGKDFIERVINSGFEVESDNFIDEVTEEEKFKYCLPEQELLFLFKKSA